LYVKKNYRDIFDKLIEIVNEYNGTNKDSDLYNPTSVFTTSINSVYQNQKWVDSLKHIDGDWFKSVKKINKIRNSADHSYRPEAIYEEIGFSGPEAFKHSKNFCLKQIYKMFNISIIK